MNQSSSPLPELPALGFLSEVSSEHRAFLASFGKFLRPRKGDVFIAEGGPQESLSLVLSGTLHAVSSAGERQLLLASLGAGDSLGEINLFDPATASATVIARSDTLIWTISAGELNVLFEADPVASLSIMKGLLCQVSKRIRNMNEKLAMSELKASFHDYWSIELP